MKPRSKRKKTFWVVVSIIVFGVGLFVGSFLVLKSETSEGALFDIENTSPAQVSNFLEDLKRFQEQNPSSSNENLTRKFLSSIAEKGVELNLTSPEQFKSKDFFYGVVAPQVQITAAEAGELFPSINDSEVRVSAKKDLKEYIPETKERLFVLAIVWQKVIATAPEETKETSLISDFEALSNILVENERMIREADVPVGARSVHAKILKLSSAIRTIVDQGVVDRKSDPLRSLLVLNSLDQIEIFAQEVLYEFADLENQQ